MSSAVLWIGFNKLSNRYVIYFAFVLTLVPSVFLYQWTIHNTRKCWETARAGTNTTGSFDRPSKQVVPRNIYSPPPTVHQMLRHVYVASRFDVEKATVNTTGTPAAEATVAAVTETSAVAVACRTGITERARGDNIVLGKIILNWRRNDKNGLLFNYLLFYCLLPIVRFRPLMLWLNKISCFVVHTYHCFVRLL